MKYQSTTAPLSKSDLDKIVCWKYVNLGVCEEDLKVWDLWFMRVRNIPSVYSISSNRGQEHRFIVEIDRQEIDVDWRIFRTWNNTFHFRYSAILASVGLKPTNRHFHPNDLFRVAKQMEAGMFPKPLSQCDLKRAFETSYFVGEK